MALSGPAIAFLPQQDVQDHPVLIHHTPEVTLHAPDPNEDFIEAPRVPRLRSAVAQLFWQTRHRTFCTSYGCSRG